MRSRGQNRLRGRVRLYSLEQLYQVLNDTIQMIIFDDKIAHFARIESFGKTFHFVKSVKGVQTKEKFILDEHFELEIELLLTVDK